jgi:CO/xanthine dehydrogenase Mo-binding subunit
MEFTRLGMAEMLQEAKGHPAWTTPLEPSPSGRPHGRGVAMGWWPNGVGTSSCRITVMPDGTLQLVVGTMDLSSTRTGFVQIAADELGLTPHDVHITTANTDGVAFTGTSGGSRVTRSMASAIYDACQSVKEQMKELVAPKLGVVPDFVEFDDGVFTAREIPDKSMTFAEAAQAVIGGSTSVVARASNDPNLRAANGYALDIVDVEVDPGTGKVELLKITAFQDAGHAVNPDQVQGQMQGGVSQGVGWALNEEYVYDDQGTLRNASLLDYRMPTALDLPMIDAVITEVPADDGPYGIRGVGEPPIIPPPAAIANAIRDAAGVRMTQLPMSPERVFWALREKADSPAAD